MTERLDVTITCPCCGCVLYKAEGVAEHRALVYASDTDEGPPMTHACSACRVAKCSCCGPTGRPPRHRWRKVGSAVQVDREDGSEGKAGLSIALSRVRETRKRWAKNPSGEQAKLDRAKQDDKEHPLTTRTR